MFEKHNASNKVQKAIFNTKVTVKFTMSLTWVSFIRESLVESLSNVSIKTTISKNVEKYNTQMDKYDSNIAPLLFSKDIKIDG